MPRIHRALAPALLLAGLILAEDASALRVMTYNLLNYGSGRTTEFRIVLEETQPDVLVAQEVVNAGAAGFFKTAVLDFVNPGEWTIGDFITGPFTNNALFFRTDKIDEIDHYAITTSVRNIDEWTLRPDGYESTEATVRLYVVHLKAGNSSSDEQQRLSEVQDMRVRMETYPPGQNYIVAGDMNVYGSTEPAYVYMTSTSGGLAGVVQDPIGVPGGWHDIPAYAPYHTQSPRTTEFGGGSIGGLDDRFDQILVGPALQDEEGFDVLESTYHAFGQDGMHFNIAIIDDPPNAVVSAEVAQALHDASDHLPVIVEFQLPPIVVADAGLSFGPVIVGGSASALLSVSNGAVPPADELDYSLSAPSGFSAPTGDYQADAGDPSNVHPIQMETGSAGDLTGDLLILSDAADSSTFAVPLEGTVLEHAQPSVSDVALSTTGTIDFGSHPVGGFSDQPAEVFNFGYDALQALLDVHDAEFTGDTRFSIAGGFTPALIGATGESWDIHFDDAGATDGTYTATLTFGTRDQQDLSGAIDLADLTYEITATVGGVSGTPIADSGPAQIGLSSIRPNPFGRATEITFGLASAGPVRISVFDVGGRVVRDLVSGTVEAGEHVVVWDGEDGRGRQVGAGIFFIRMRTPRMEETRPIVRVR